MLPADLIGTSPAYTGFGSKLRPLFDSVQHLLPDKLWLGDFVKYKYYECKLSETATKSASGINDLNAIRADLTLYFYIGACSIVPFKSHGINTLNMICHSAATQPELLSFVFDSSSTNRRQYACQRAKIILQIKAEMTPDIWMGEKHLPTSYQKIVRPNAPKWRKIGQFSERTLTTFGAIVYKRLWDIAPDRVSGGSSGFANMSPKPLLHAATYTVRMYGKCPLPDSV